MSASSAARSWLTFAALLLSTGTFPATATAQSRTLPRAHLVEVTNSSSIDPCRIASPDEIRQLLEGWISAAFPIKKRMSGQHVTLSRPDLRGFSCPDLRFELRVRVRYQKTRGFPQYSTTGVARLGSRAVFTVSHSPVEFNKSVPAAQVENAFMYLTHLNVIGLNLRRVPNWLENGEFIRRMLFPALMYYGGDVTSSEPRCLDVTSWMKQKLAKGMDVPAGGRGLSCP